MKKIIKTFMIIIFLCALGALKVRASNENDKKNTSIQVEISKTICVDKQINGISQDYFEYEVIPNNIEITIQDQFGRWQYSDFKKAEVNKELDYFVFDVNSFSEDAILTVEGELECKELSRVEKFMESIRLDDFKEVNKNGNLKYNVLLDKVLLGKCFTTDVVFKCDEGGYFDQDIDSLNTQYLEYTGLIEKSDFPTFPKVIAEDGYEFLGWYSEESNEFIDSFPKKINENCTFVAKFKYKSNLADNKNVKVATLKTKEMKSGSPPTNIQIKNVFWGIVLLIINLTWIEKSKRKNK